MSLVATRPVLALVALASACSPQEGPVPGVFDSDGGVIIWRPGDGGELPDGGPNDAGIEEDLGADGGLDLGSLDGGATEDGGTTVDMGLDPCLDPVELVTTASAAATVGSLLGRVVEVEGFLAAEAPICDGPACGPDDPCCQTCTAAVRLDGILDLQGGVCTPFSAGCRGTSCSLSCSPPLLDVPVAFRGRVLEGARLEVLEQLR